MNIDYIEQFNDLPLDITLDFSPGIVLTPEYSNNPILDKFITSIFTFYFEEFKPFLVDGVFRSVPTSMLMECYEQLLLMKDKEIEEWFKKNFPKTINKLAKEAAKESHNKLIDFYQIPYSYGDFSCKECWFVYITPFGNIFTSIEYKPTSFNPKLIEKSLLDIKRRLYHEYNKTHQSI